MTDLLTVRAAADRLGVSYSTLKQWIYDGAVRTIRTRGGHHRVAEIEVQRLLLSSAAPGPKRTAKGGRRGRRPAQPSGVLVALSGRNQLRGIVEEVRSDGILAQVRLRIGDQRLTAVITRDAVAELQLAALAELAAVVVAGEEERVGDLAAEAAGDVDELDEPDDGGFGQRKSFAADDVDAVRLHDFRFPLDHEPERPAHGHHRERLERGVQRQTAHRRIPLEPKSAV